MKKYFLHFLERTKIVVGRQWRTTLGYFFTTSLLVSWVYRRIVSSANNAYSLDSFEGIDVIYINLERRPDRRTAVEKELRSMRIVSPTRFPAVDGSIFAPKSFTVQQLGSIGCAKSHRDLLRRLKESQHPVMVCEDDLVFSAEPESLLRVLSEFYADARLDVLCLAANIGDTPLRISQSFAISRDISTTACYVLKPRAIPHLESTFSDAVTRLEGGESIQKASIDQRWKTLQRGRLIFCVPRIQMARQGRSFSDITGEVEDRGV